MACCFPARRYRERLSFAKIISAGCDGANSHTAGVRTMAAQRWMAAKSESRNTASPDTMSALPPKADITSELGLRYLQQRRQLGDVRCDPSRFVAGELFGPAVLWISSCFAGLILC
jgi:hypothetical protein